MSALMEIEIYLAQLKQFLTKQIWLQLANKYIAHLVWILRKEADKKLKKKIAKLNFKCREN